MAVAHKKRCRLLQCSPSLAYYLLGSKVVLIFGTLCGNPRLFVEASGPGGYITPAAWGHPDASKAGDKIRRGPQVGRVAT